MFKFIKQYAENINHVDIYPIISLFIFFSFCGVAGDGEENEKGKNRNIVQYPI